MDESSPFKSHLLTLKFLLADQLDGTFTFFQQAAKDFETTHTQNRDTDLISEPRTYTIYLSQKVSSFILQMSYEQRYYTTKTHALLSSQTIMRQEKVRPGYKTKETSR
jgi:hypothetical protein